MFVFVQMFLLSKLDEVARLSLLEIALKRLHVKQWMYNLLSLICQTQSKNTNIIGN